MIHATRRSKRIGTRLGLVVGGLVGLLALGGCASSGALSAAESGDLSALRTAIIEERKAGSLDDDDVGDIAQAVAEHDIKTSRGSLGKKTLRGYRTCARDVQSAYEDRARAGGALASEATLILLEHGLSSREDFVTHADHADAGWRAVGARVLVGAEHGERRRALMLDLDQWVRHSAMRAAADEPDQADRDLLLDSARRDPWPLARTLATRAVGGLGGELVVLALKDIWAQAQDSDREAIAAAWGHQACLDTGGRRQLLWAAQNESGSPAIAAAIELARDGGAGSAEARGVLARSVREGPTQDRIFAVGAAPASPEVLEALQDSKADDDQAVRVAVLSRLAGTRSGKERKAALVALRKIERDEDSRFAGRARAALASQGDASVVPALEKDLASDDAPTRRRAARGLIALGRLTRAVDLVADDESAVRSSVACHILGARRAR